MTYDNVDQPPDRVTHIALMRERGGGNDTLCGVPIEDVNHCIRADPTKPHPLRPVAGLPMCSMCFDKLQKKPGQPEPTTSKRIQFLVTIPEGVSGLSVTGFGDLLKDYIATATKWKAEVVRIVHGHPEGVDCDDVEEALESAKDDIRNLQVLRDGLDGAVQKLRDARDARTGTCGECGGRRIVAATPGRGEDGTIPCPRCFPGQRLKQFAGLAEFDAWLAENTHRRVVSTFYLPPFGGSGMAQGSGHLHVIHEEAQPRGA